MSKEQEAEEQGGGCAARRAGAGAPGHPARRIRDAGRAGADAPAVQRRSGRTRSRSATASTAHAMLAEGHTPEQAAALGRNAMAGTSTIADGVLAQSPDRPPACRAGCAHCCHQSVGVTPPEVFAIYEHLRATRTPDELDAVVQAPSRRRRQHAGHGRRSTGCRRICRARSWSTRAARSTRRGRSPAGARTRWTRAACERTLRDPAARAAFLAGTVSVPCYLEPIRAFHAVTAGLQLALDQLHGLEAPPLELTAAMRIMADDPETVPAAVAGRKRPVRRGPRRRQHRRPAHRQTERPRANSAEPTHIKQSPLSGALFRSSLGGGGPAML